MKILLVQTGFLGDVVLSTPLINNLRKLYPPAQISVMTTPLAAPLVASHPEVAQVITFDKRGADSGWPGLARMARMLRAEGFAKVFSLHKSVRTAVLLRLACIPERVGFAEAGASFLYTRTARRSDLAHEVLRNLALLRTAGLEPSALNSSLVLSIPGEVQRRADLLLDAVAANEGPAAAPLIGLAPGSVWATKRWTAEGFCRVAEALYEDGFKVLILGAESDADCAAEIERKARVPVVNLAGKTDLITSAAVISRLRILVTNDSAPLHVAAACKVSVVAVFCATVPEFGFAPWGVAHECVGLPELSCRPCGRHGAQRCPVGTNACAKSLPAEAVISAVRRVLARAAASMDDGAAQAARQAY